ncbi:glycosyl hydrolase [Echria macrotheca]|uniref:mannan endo-1,6-alpha-mannosidase n=1 Tax=Echria macrotheca TaxID=438768 RepID=A0AAJ0BHT0_9PEZI|nr:glycosyl hydrolase [Echria macrotheca]
MRPNARLVSHLALASGVAATYKFDMGSSDSIKSVASSIADDMMSFYHGHEAGQTPGLLPKPYYWWEAGALMGALVDYWYYTGDTKWNSLATEGLLFQVGPNNDYMPPNQTVTEGNDDQGFWGMAVMSAAEYKYPNPPEDKPQWLALAQAVFNTQAPRWDTQDCGGGLRWQIFTWNNGYDYKNSITQACFFNIAARLARYTGNASYAEWADKTWNWMTDTQLMRSDSYFIYDGIHIMNCSAQTPYQWSYNVGAFLLGAAAMYNYTVGTPAHETWRERVDGLLNGSSLFFEGPNKDIMFEVPCEGVNMCNLDQQSFKAYLGRWMASSIKFAPWISGRVKPLLKASAEAAVSTCTGGSNGKMCGLKWTEPGKWDGTTGVGQQMAVMQMALSGLIDESPDPVTHAQGVSVGNPSAGGQDVGKTDPFAIIYGDEPVTVAGKAGAAILTTLVLLGLIAGCGFVLVEEGADKSWWEWIKGLRVKEQTDSIPGAEAEKNVGPAVETCENVSLGDRASTRERSTPSDMDSYWSVNSNGKSSPASSKKGDGSAVVLRKMAMQQNREKTVRWEGTKRDV